MLEHLHTKYFSQNIHICLMSYFALFCCGQGPDSIYRYRLTKIGNPIVEIRRSYDRLISTMGFPILIRRLVYIESGPRFWPVSPVSYSLTSLTPGQWYRISPVLVKQPWRIWITDSPESLNYTQPRQNKAQQNYVYRKISSIKRIKSQNVSRFSLQLSLHNILKPGVKWRMKM